MIRPVIEADLPFLKQVIDEVELFPSDMLDGMLAASLTDPTCKEVWLTFDAGKPCAVGYCSPEQMTEGTWNQLLIAVSPAKQGTGIGTALLKEMEQRLAKTGQRILLVETSGLPDFEATREFYRKRGFEKEARIRDFYAAGDDKIVFRKLLDQAD